MESAGKRRRRRTSHGDNSLVADFIELRDSEMADTGPKRPRWGSGEMWLTPDPLTPLDNFGRGKRRRSSFSKPPSEGTTASGGMTANGGKTPSGGTTATGSGGKTPSGGKTVTGSAGKAANERRRSGSRRKSVKITPFKRKSPGRSDESANIGPLFTPVSDRVAAVDVPGLSQESANTDTTASSKKRQPRANNDNKENEGIVQIEGHVSPPEIEGHGEFPPESDGTQSASSPIGYRTPSHNEEASIAETPPIKEPSSVRSTVTRQLRSALKDIHTLSSLRRQATRNSRVSFGRFVTVAEYRPENVKGITLTEDSPLLGSSPSPEKDTTVSSPEVRGQSPEGEEEEEEERVMDYGRMLVGNSPSPEKTAALSSPELSCQSQEDEGEGMAERVSDESLEGEVMEDVSGESSESGVADGGELSSSVELEPLGEEEGGSDEVEGELEEEALIEEIEEMRSGRSSVKTKKRSFVVIQKKKKKPAKTLPRAVVKNLFTLSSKRRVTKDAMDLILKFSEVYLKQASRDIAVYAAHAGRKTVDVDDVVLLLQRQRVVTENRPFEYLVNEHLPLEYVDQLLPCAVAGKDITPPLR